MASNEQSAASVGKPILRQSDFSEVVLPSLPPIPGMISASEQRYLYHLAHDVCQGPGAVVEVGTWLGRSTSALAVGLTSRQSRQTLHCFDRYLWKAFHGEIVDLPLQPGQDFQPYFEENVRPLISRLQVTKTDLSQIVWDEGPIDLLVLDAPKKAVTLRQALEIFGPALLPGQSRVVFQDYLYFPSYELAACLSQLQDCLEPADVVLEGMTVGFRVAAPITMESISESCWRPETWRLGEIQAAWDQILSPLHPSARELLEAGFPWHLYDAGLTPEAVRQMKAISWTPAQKAQLQRQADSKLYADYRALFATCGIRSGWDQELRSMWRKGKRWMNSLVAKPSGDSRSRVA